MITKFRIGELVTRSPSANSVKDGEPGYPTSRCIYRVQRTKEGPGLFGSLARGYVKVSGLGYLDDAWFAKVKIEDVA